MSKHYFVAREVITRQNPAPGENLTFFGDKRMKQLTLILCLKEFLNKYKDFESFEVYEYCEGVHYGFEKGFFFKQFKDRTEAEEFLKTLEG